MASIAGMHADLPLTDDLRQAILDHAGREAPRECCGLLVRLPDGVRYAPARNVFPGEGHDRFRIDPQTWADCEDAGEILAVVHSHPQASANPSMADRLGCERSGVPWLICGWPSGVFVAVEPEGWEAPLVGREFCFGVLDCYTLIQDYYRRELNIVLPDFEREFGFWEPTPDRPAQDLYMQGLAEAGFVVVQGEPRRHDGLLMEIRSTPGIANHGAVYLGGGVMLHHLLGQLSTRTVYGGAWERCTRAVVRHGSLL